MKTTKKILIMFVVIITLNTNIISQSFSIEVRSNSEIFQIMKDKESLKNIPLNEPKSSAFSDNITKTGNILDGATYEVMIVGTLAYIADSFGGLKIIDISDPTAPVKVGQFDDGGFPQGIYISGFGSV